MKKSFIYLFFIVSFISLQVLAENLPQKTLINLNKAFRGETNASHRYELYAQQADKEGYYQIGKLFRAISMAESIHRNNHRAAILILGGKPDVIEYDKVTVGSTKENLNHQIKGEEYENTEMYPNFIKQAKIDKADQAVTSFTYAKDTELQHERLIKEAFANLGKNKNMSYCINRISGSTTEVIPSGKCPSKTFPVEQYIKIK